MVVMFLESEEFDSIVFDCDVMNFLYGGDELL